VSALSGTDTDACINLIKGLAKGFQRRSEFGVRSRLPVPGTGELEVENGSHSIGSRFSFTRSYDNQLLTSKRKEPVPIAAQFPSSRTLGTFNSIFEKGPYFGYAEVFARRNLIALQPYVSFISARPLL
jgi:hypothetical protein